MNGILEDPAMAQVLAQARSLDDCNQVPSDIADTNKWKSVAKNNALAMVTTSCAVAASSDPGLIGEACEASMSVVSDGDGHASQTNQGAVSSGSGDLYWFITTAKGSSTFGTYYLWAQQNHATGAGCTQDALNVIGLDTTNFRFCVATFIKSSTCGGAGLWKVSTGSFTGSQSW